MTPRELHDERWRVAILMFACMLVLYALDSMLIRASETMLRPDAVKTDGGHNARSER